MSSRDLRRRHPSQSRPSPLALYLGRADLTAQRAAERDAHRAAELDAEQAAGDRIARRREQIVRRHLVDARVWWWAPSGAVEDGRWGRGR